MYAGREPCAFQILQTKLSSKFPLPMATQPEQQQTDPPSVPLPNRRSKDQPNGNRPPVWFVEEAPGPDVSNAPLQAKCSAHGEDRDGICCRELIGEDERQLIDPDIVRDAYVLLLFLPRFAD